MKKLILILLFISLQIKAQNKPVLYGFDEIPQTLLLNPASETNYRFHVGVPALSGIMFDAGVSGITVADLFRNDGIDFNVKVKNAINKLSIDDQLSVNLQVDILNGGFKYDERTYLSFGYYVEADVFMTAPKEFLELAEYGNEPYLNKTFSASQANGKAELVGVLHAGITRRMNDKLTLGGRFKIYSGSLNAMSTGNQGDFTTTLGSTNIYHHNLSNLNVSAYTSGFINADDEFSVEGNDIVSRTLLGGSYGLGIDLGVTYKPSRHTEYTASLLDVGFVSFSNQTKNISATGSYEFNGVRILSDETGGYWQQLKDEFDENIPRQENNDSYTSMRPIKFNGSVKYKFGKSRSLRGCFDIGFNEDFDNAIGGQLFTVFRPGVTQVAVTGFYERRLLKGLKSKITYTIDDFSATNVGLGFSAKIAKRVNFYGMVDNVFGLSDIADTNRAGFQFGFNVLFP